MIAGTTKVRGDAYGDQITSAGDKYLYALQNMMLQVVAPEWLEDCLAVGSRVDEQKYRIQLEYCCDSGESWPDL